MIGTTSTMMSPGKLVFNIEDTLCSLDIMSMSDENYWLIFADKTSGLETYGSGRYIYADKTSENGSAIIDFNKAYNPPCAFTEFATCPLAPSQNILQVHISAGEKKYGKSKH